MKTFTVDPSQCQRNSINCLLPNKIAHMRASHDAPLTHLIVPQSIDQNFLVRLCVTTVQHGRSDQQLWVAFDSQQKKQFQPAQLVVCQALAMLAMMTSQAQNTSRLEAYCATMSPPPTIAAVHEIKAILIMAKLIGLQFLPNPKYVSQATAKDLVQWYVSCHALTSHPQTKLVHHSLLQLAEASHGTCAAHAFGLLLRCNAPQPLLKMYNKNPINQTAWNLAMQHDNNNDATQSLQHATAAWVTP